MMPAFPILAEVADKEPPVWAFVACAVVCILASWPLVRWKKWLAIVALLLAFLSAAFVLEEVRSPDVGPAIIAEMGYSYVLIAYASALAPFVLIIALLLGKKRGEPCASANVGAAPRHGTS
jgi:hypothetical protein